MGSCALPQACTRAVGKTLLHTGVAFALLRLMPGGVESPVIAFVSIVLLVVPALSYALLCSIWMLRHVQSAMGV